MHFLFCAFILAIGSGQGQGQIPLGSPQVLLSTFNTSRSANHPLKSIPDFVMHLKNVTFDSIFSSNAVYFIVDPQYSKLSINQIQQLKSRNKIVLAYLDVSRTDPSRPYWRYQWDTSLPDFIDAQLTHGGFSIKFWSPVWQRTLLRFMREFILSNKYSGIYLDGVNIYKHYENSEPDAAGQMVTFVRNIRGQARAIAPDTLIFAHTQPDLYEINGFPNAVEGVGVENIWFAHDTALPKENRELKLAEKAHQDGKVVLAMDYPSRPENVCSFYERCYTESFMCAVIADKNTGATRACEKIQESLLTSATPGTSNSTSTPGKPALTSTTSRRPTKRPSSSSNSVSASLSSVVMLLVMETVF